MTADIGIAQDLTREKKIELLQLRSERQRRKACKSLNVFAERMLELRPAAHHRFVNDALMAVDKGELKRLMLFEPPGHAKSTYTSWLFVAWYLARHARESIIQVSHTQEFSEHWGRKVRNLFMMPEWPFENVRLQADNQAVGRWEATNGADYFAVGVGGAVTGRRADLVVIDDPMKGREMADSETQRQKLWEWYLADLRTRLKPQGAVIIIQTRWHELDLAGRILPEDWGNQSGIVKGRDGDEWTVISLPAIAEHDDALGRMPGEPLWPDWFPLDKLLVEKRDDRNWSALYQQRPAPEEGEYFKKDWIRWYDTPPAAHTLRIYGASDYAYTKQGDFTVHMVAGVDSESNLYVLDMWRARVDSSQAVDAWAGVVERWRPIEWAEDKAQIEGVLGPFLDSRQHEMQIFCHREPYPCKTDKQTRAQSIRGRMAQGKVYLPKSAPWINDLVTEMMVFPNGRNDDQVDCMSLFGRMLDKMRPRKAVSNLPATADTDYSVHHW